MPKTPKRINISVPPDLVREIQAVLNLRAENEKLHDLLSQIEKLATRSYGI